MRTLSHRWLSEIHCSLFSAAAQYIQAALPVALFLVAGCGGPKAAPAVPSPEVEVASVLQKDVPIFSEWVATLDGYINAQIQARVAGYVIRQTYKEGSENPSVYFVLKNHDATILSATYKEGIAVESARLGVGTFRFSGALPVDPLATE
jgi:hypothetical protein